MLGGRLATLAVASLLLGGVGAPPVHAGTATGPRETITLEFTSVLPNAPTGYRFRAHYRHPSNPAADPPAVRGMTFDGPRGGRTDTSVAPQCTAGDQELRMRGEAACPAGSRFSSGTVTVSLLGLGRGTGTMMGFNAPNQELDIVRFGGFVGGVVRNYYTGSGYTNKVSTCFAGGQPPSGCARDEVRLISSAQSAPPVIAGSGARRRGLVTNPPTCPRSGVWPSRFTVWFADGSVDRLAMGHRCTRPGLRVRRRGCTVTARVTGRDLREVSRVDFYRNGRLVGRDRKAPFRDRLHVRRTKRTRVTAIVRAYGVRIARVYRRVGRCR